MRTLTPLWSAMLLAMASMQVHAMTLSEAIQSTLDNHPEVRAAVNSRDASAGFSSAVSAVVVRSANSWASSTITTSSSGSSGT